jgi:PKD repeat protein
VSLDGNGDGTFETALDPLLQSENVPFNFIANGGNPPPSGGQPWASVDDHTTRVSSDYVMWYDVADLLSGQSPRVNVDTRGSFDGRMKVITLVVAYNDGDDDQVYYWVNQGHDVDSYYRDYPVYAPLQWNDYVGETSFSGIPAGFASATLTVNHMASSDGLYTFGGCDLTRYDSSGGNSSVQSAYSGFDVWNVTGYIAGDSAALTYDRSAINDSGGGYSGEYYKIPLSALAVRMPVGVPVAEFSANVTGGYVPLCVQFADLSTGTVTGWAWDFEDDGTVDSTLQNPVHTYPSIGTYRVNLTVTGPDGSDSLARTGYITVNAAPQYDLYIVRITIPKVTVYAKENNTVTVVVKNNGPDPSPATEVELQSSDGFVGRALVPALNASQQAELKIVDTIIRPLEGGSVTYTARVDPDNILTETNEDNNAYNINCPVRYNGYKGKRYWEGGSDITTRRTYDLQGGLAYSQGNDIYHAGQWNNYTVTWTGSQPVIPAGATVVEAYLYVSWCWDEKDFFPAQFDLAFNGQPVTWVNYYLDKGNHASVWGSYQYGLAPCDVTSLYVPNGVNTLTVGRLDGKSSSIATFPFTLMVIYADGNASRKQIFINEEYDVLAYSQTDYGTTLDETIAYAPFTGMAIDLVNVSTATLYSFATHAGNPEGNLYFNNQTVAMGAYHGTSSTSNAEVYSVKSLLNATGNEAAIQGTDGGSMGAIQQVLVVEYPHPVASFTANATSGYPPLTVQFDSDASAGSITSYAWDFDNDGLTDSVEANPSYTYNTPGTYTVNLTVTGPGGSNSTVKPGYISVLSSYVVSLVPGWNLVSWPLDNSSLRASDLVNNASLGVDLVTMFNSATGMFSSYYRGANPSKDFVMTSDVGYFVKATGAGGFSVAGQPIPAHNISVYTGWNLIGWSSFTSVYASDVLARAAYVDLVTKYSPLTGMFTSFYRGANPSKDFLLTAGSGYFVKSVSASVQQLYVG